MRTTTTTDVFLICLGLHTVRGILTSAPFPHLKHSLWQELHIDRLHKWRPKKYSFLFMLIRLTSLVGTDKIQEKWSFRTSLVGLIFCEVIHEIFHNLLEYFIAYLNIFLAAI